MRRSIWISINRTEKSNRIIIARDAHPINSASTSATERQPLEWRFFSTTSYMCTGVATAILRLSYGIRDSPKLVHPIYAIYSLHIHTHTRVCEDTRSRPSSNRSTLSTVYASSSLYYFAREMVRKKVHAAIHEKVTEVRDFGQKLSQEYSTSDEEAVT